MATLDVHIYGKAYSISCDNGQEKHLKELAVYLDRKVRSIAAATGSTATGSELDLMVVTALMITDELNDITLELSELKSELEELRAGAPVRQEGAISVEAFQKGIDNIAEKIEAIAEELEKA